MEICVVDRHKHWLIELKNQIRANGKGVEEEEDRRRVYIVKEKQRRKEREKEMGSMVWGINCVAS